MLGHNVFPITRGQDGATVGKGESLTVGNALKAMFDGDTAVGGPVKLLVFGAGAAVMNAIMTNTYTGKLTLSNPLRVHRRARLTISEAVAAAPMQSDGFIGSGLRIG